MSDKNNRAARAVVGGGVLLAALVGLQSSDAQAQAPVEDSLADIVGADGFDYDLDRLATVTIESSRLSLIMN